MSKQTLLRAGLVVLFVALAAGWAVTALLLSQRLSTLKAEQKTTGVRMAAPTFQINVPASAFEITPQQAKQTNQVMNYQIGRTLVWVNASPIAENSNYLKLPFKRFASLFYKNVSDRVLSTYKGMPIEYVYAHTKLSRQVIALLLDQKEVYQISVTEMNPASDAHLRQALDNVLAKFVFNPTAAPAVHPQSGADGDGDHDNDSSVKTDDDHDAPGQPPATTTSSSSAAKHRRTK